jgi:hypothetical protein
MCWSRILKLKDIKGGDRHTDRQTKRRIGRKKEGKKEERT